MAGLTWDAAYGSGMIANNASSPYIIEAWPAGRFVATEELRMWYQGVYGDSPWIIISTFLVFAHMTLIAVTVYLHRYSAHRALELHPLLQHGFRFWLWLTTGIETKAWTAIHRKHHVHCETADDPHSPVIFGMATVLRTGAELYQRADIPETLEKHGMGTPEDWVEKVVYRHLNHGIALMLLIDLALFGALGITVWAMQMMLSPLLAAGVINGLGHGLGYRNFEIPNASTNIVPWGIVIAGEELHNNHHTYPNSAKLSVKPWEFDIGWLWIRLFEWLRLARTRATAPAVQRIAGKSLIDLDTAWAAVGDRFNIMSRYAEQVIKPLVDMERRQAIAQQKKQQQALLKRARTLLCRETSLLDEQKISEMQRVLRQHPRLLAIYEMRESLAEVWQQRNRSREDMLAALRDWCHRAERSGIDSLSEFAAYLRSYSRVSTTGN